MSNFTKGPWIIEYDNADESSGGQWYDVGPAEVHYSYNSTKKQEEEALANAKLIASAPRLHEENIKLREVNTELLEALKEIKEWDFDGQTFWSDIENLREFAKQAIAKATGNKAEGEL